MPRTVMLLAALAALGCGIDEATHGAVLKELDETRARLKQTEEDCAAQRDRLGSEVTDLKQENAELTQRLQALGQNVGTLESDLARARKLADDLRRSQEVAEKRAAQFRQLLARFREMISEGKLKVQIRKGRMLVKLSDEILFDPGRTDIKAQGQEALRQVTEILREIPDRHFQVAGHTDNVPIRTRRFGSNWELSAARALRVVAFMVESGMDASRLSACGYADQDPVGPNDSEEGRAQNRRIEIVLQPNLEELPSLEGLGEQAG